MDDLSVFILFFLITNDSPFVFIRKKNSLVCPQINAPPPPRSPPPTSSRSSSSRGGGASNASTCPLTRSDDTLCQLPPEIPREHLEVVQTLTKTHFGEVRNNVISATVSVCVVKFVFVNTNSWEYTFFLFLVSILWERHSHGSMVLVDCMTIFIVYDPTARQFDAKLNDSVYLKFILIINQK